MAKLLLLLMVLMTVGSGDAWNLGGSDNDTDTKSSSGVKTKNPGHDIDGKTNVELFKKYRCRVCKDLLIDNIELVDGELIINEKLVINFCETFLSKVLHVGFGGIACHTVVRSTLDKALKSVVGTQSETLVGNIVCKAIHFC